MNKGCGGNHVGQWDDFSAPFPTDAGIAEADLMFNGDGGADAEQQRANGFAEGEITFLACR